MMGYRTQHSRYPSNVQEQTPSSPGLLQRLFCRLRRRREEEKVGTPHPPQGGCRPLDPRLADGIPDFATALVFGQGFSVFVMLAGRSPARKGREVPATPRRGVAGTSLPLLCAPLGARTQAAGVRGEENGKALALRSPPQVHQREGRLMNVWGGSCWSHTVRFCLAPVP